MFLYDKDDDRERLLDLLILTIPHVVYYSESIKVTSRKAGSLFMRVE